VFTEAHVGHLVRLWFDLLRTLFASQLLARFFPA
jgi:hypothetical protein